MKKRIVGILAAVLLAVVGTTLLVKYVQSAKEDAINDEAQVEVVIVTDEIPQGAAVSAIRDRVTVAEIPQRLLAPGAITDMTLVDDQLVAAVTLREGEQLLASRLVDERSLVRVDVPAGLQQITLALSPERAVGADLQPGDTVGVLFSFDPFDVSVSGAAATEPAQPDSDPTVTTVAPTKTPNMTHFTLHKVLVTGVQFSQKDSERATVIQTDDIDSTDTTISATVEEAPSDEVLVTLAVTAAEAEQLVFAKEFGMVWLTSENDDASEDGTRIVTLEVVYVTGAR